MKILVLGSYFSDNLGDGVICECVAQQLQTAFPDAEVCIYDLLMRDCFRKSEIPSISSLNQNRYHVIARRLVSRFHLVDKQLLSSTMRMEANRAQIERMKNIECDAVVFAGGQVLMDSYALIVEQYIQILEERSIPVFLNACGMGATVSKTVRNRLSNVLLYPCVRWISCRDDVSLLENVYLKKKKRVVPIADGALWCDEVYGIWKHDSSVVGLGIMYPDTEKVSPRRALNFWLKIIRKLDQEKIEWKIFVNGGVSDIAFAEYVYQHIPEPKRPLNEAFSIYPCTPKDLVETISQFSSIISFRLHSHIIAASLGIPSISICWDDKVRLFFEKVGCPERCFSPNDRISDIFAQFQEMSLGGVNQNLVRRLREEQRELLCAELRKEFANGEI